MVRILFDDQAFKMQRYGGVSRYFSELIKGVSNHSGTVALPGKFISSNGHLRNNGQLLYPQLTFGKYFKGRDRLLAWLSQRESRRLLNILRKGAFDVFHPTYFDTYFLREIKNKPFVLTVHDMIHELYFDANNQETYNRQKLIPLAAHIISVSEHTKRDILDLFPDIKPDKISVVYHGSSLSFHRQDKDILLPEKYFLFVGTRNFYKNFDWLLRTIAQLLKERNYCLVCAGGGSFTDDEEKLIQQLGLQKNIVFVDARSDEKLAHVYASATCLIFPSLYEGFGIPIIEAFSCRCPVLLCDETCFPEIGEKAAAYFSLTKHETLLELLQRLLDEPGVATHLIEKGSERSKIFSWEKMVDQHIAIYQNLLCNG